MKNTMKTLNEIYKVNGENGKYATLYENEDEIIEVYGDIDFFMERLDVNPQKELSVETINYPVIVFDTSASVGENLFEANQVDEVLEVASVYFDRK